MDFTKADVYFKNNCIRCHGSKRQKGDFRIDNLGRDFTSSHDAEYWAEILDRIATGDMPPEDEEQPPIEESSAIVDFLTAKLDSGEAARLAKREEVTHYRLSREEYANTIKDLLGVSFDPAAPGAMLPDPDYQGFQRVGAKLDLAPAHVEKYLRISEKVINLATDEREIPFETSVRKGFDMHSHASSHRERLEKEGRLDDVRLIMMPGQSVDYEGAAPAWGQIKVDGNYRLRIKASGLQPDGGLAPHLRMYSMDDERIVFETDLIAPEGDPVIIDKIVFLSRGTYNMRFEHTAPVEDRSRSVFPSDRPFFKFSDGPLEGNRYPWHRKLLSKEGKPFMPVLLIDWVEWSGPILTDEDQAKKAEVLGYLPTAESTDEEIRSNLESFMCKAWRRPVETAELDPYLSLFRSEAAASRDVRESFKSAMLAVLASSNFYYLREGRPGQRLEKVDDYELASRLSYFFWSSMPDEELFAAAAKGTLHQQDELKRQIRRMLADPRAERFSGTFPRQWLELRKVGMFPPDKMLYPDYDLWLEESMVGESVEFFKTVLRENLSIGEFLKSDWTMLNPRLATHYGIPYEGDSGGFEKIALKPEHNRGGILSNASVLSLTSDGTRHRPVHRGVWLSEVILGKTPPPPPPNVPTIEPNPVTAPKATIRMKIAAHANDPNCASCHAKIDPLGLAFDNYDAVGRWRTHEVVSDGQGDDPPVDASGKLVDGRRFLGPVEFRELLAEDIDVFARAFVGKLATFGLRRAVSFEDDKQIRAIADSCKPEGYKLADLIESFVVSDLFLKR